MSKEQEVKHEKLDQIITKLDKIEDSIFKIIESKLASFRIELAQQVDDHFAGLKKYLDKKVSGVRNDLESQITDHEDRITILEKETGITPLENTKRGLILKNKKRKMIILAFIIGASITLMNATVLILILTRSIS